MDATILSTFLRPILTVASVWNTKKLLTYLRTNIKKIEDIQIWNFFIFIFQFLNPTHTATRVVTTPAGSTTRAGLTSQPNSWPSSKRSSTSTSTWPEPEESRLPEPYSWTRPRSKFGSRIVEWNRRNGWRKGSFHKIIQWRGKPHPPWGDTHPSQPHTTTQTVIAVVDPLKVTHRILYSWHKKYSYKN